MGACGWQAADSHRSKGFEPCSLCLSGSLSNPHPLGRLEPIELSSFQHSTKMAVVRLLQRNGPEREGKRPEMGLRPVPWFGQAAGMAAFCGFAAAAGGGKECPDRRLAEREGFELAVRPRQALLHPDTTTLRTHSLLADCRFRLIVLSRMIALKCHQPAYLRSSIEVVFNASRPHADARYRGAARDRSRRSSRISRMTMRTRRRGSRDERWSRAGGA